MAEPAETSGVEFRLVGIDLPRVQVEDGRAILLLVDSRDPPAGPPIWQDAEIAAAGHRQIQRTELRRRTGYFDQASHRSVDSIRTPIRNRNAVAVVSDWEDAGVIPVAF